MTLWDGSVEGFLYIYIRMSIYHFSKDNGTSNYPWEDEWSNGIKVECVTKLPPTTSTTTSSPTSKITTSDSTTTIQSTDTPPIGLKLHIPNFCLGVRSQHLQNNCF